MLRKILLPLLLLLASSMAFAEIKLPAVVASNMVLQRNTAVQLWGWADKGEKIAIDCSWLDAPLTVKADKHGKWSVDVNTTNSKEQQSIKLESKQSEILLDNILFGEVWLCSGQSNMQQPVHGYNGQPTYGTHHALLNARNAQLRLFTVDRVPSATPLDTLVSYTTWQQANSDNVASFSAVAYYFGQQLQEILDVPVGLIHTSWGGSSVQAWMSKEVIEQYQEVNLKNVNMKKSPNHIPTALYNAMIHPLLPYTIKGALWYQGESNRLEPELYRQYFPAMVKDWRQRWGLGDFPFYYVQIAPYIYGGDKADIYNTPANTAFIREVQAACLDLIPNSGMAVTMDIGEQACIHPAKKKEVAERLLFNALNKTYGLKSFKTDGPVFDKLEGKDQALLLSFKNADMGLYAYDALQGFEVAGEDRVFYPAEAKIVKRKKLSVKSANVPQPVAVRYCWRNWTVGTLYDTYLLPASSFRTDNWDDATRVAE